VWLDPSDLSTRFATHPRALEAIILASETLHALSGQIYTPVHDVVDTFTSPTFRLTCFPVAEIRWVQVGDRMLGAHEFEVIRERGLFSLCDPDTCGDICIQVGYRCGSDVPPNAKLAARELAEQILLGMEGSSACQLPARVTSISRQGVSMQLLDPQEFLNDGRTGIYLVDLFLRAVNPARAVAPPRVFIPEWQSRPCACARTRACACTSP
jgi:hypothetical protein